MPVPLTQSKNAAQKTEIELFQKGAASQGTQSLDPRNLGNIRETSKLHRIIV